jgi:hypothetical protein
MQNLKNYYAILKLERPEQHGLNLCYKFDVICEFDLEMVKLR